MPVRFHITRTVHLPALGLFALVGEVLEGEIGPGQRVSFPGLESPLRVLRQSTVIEAGLGCPWHFATQTMANSIGGPHFL